MKTDNDVSCGAAAHQLPSGFIIEIRADGTAVISRKIRKTLLAELLIAAGSVIGGCLLLRSAFRLAMWLFALAALMLAGMWMSVQKLGFSVSDGTITWRRGPGRGKVAAADIVTLDAVQLGENARSFAVIAGDREGKNHHLFRYLDEDEAKALIGWIVRQIGE